MIFCSYSKVHHYLYLNHTGVQKQLLVFFIRHMQCFSVNVKSTGHILPFFLLLVSCSRIFVPSGNEYRQYAINNDLPPDSSSILYYQPYKKQLDAEMSRIVGYTDADLTKPAAATETLLGNFFADALLAEGRRLYPDADFSFGTKGGLRRELKQGPVTIGHIFELMPFENDLVILELTGESVQQLAAFIAATGGQPVAGLQMTISGGEAKDIRIANAPLDLLKTYHLVTYDYLANGGDRVKGLEYPLKRTNSGKKVRELLMDYVSRQTAEGKTIHTQTDGRITTAQ